MIAKYLNIRFFSLTICILFSVLLCFGCEDKKKPSKGCNPKCSEDEVCISGGCFSGSTDNIVNPECNPECSENQKCENGNCVDLVVNNDTNLSYIKISGKLYFPNYKNQTTVRIMALSYDENDPDKCKEANSGTNSQIDPCVFVTNKDIYLSDDDNAEPFINYELNVNKNYGTVYIVANALDSDFELYNNTSFIDSETGALKGIEVKTDKIENIDLYMGEVSISGKIEFQGTARLGDIIIAVTSEEHTGNILNPAIMDNYTIKKMDDTFIIEGVLVYSKSVYIYAFEDVIANERHDESEKFTKYEFNPINILNGNVENITIMFSEQTEPDTVIVTGNIEFPSYNLEEYGDLQVIAIPADCYTGESDECEGEPPIGLATLEVEQNDVTVNGFHKSYNLPVPKNSGFVYVIASTEKTNVNTNPDLEPTPKVSQVHSVINNETKKIEIQSIEIQSEQISDVDLYMGETELRGTIQYPEYQQGPIIIIGSIDNQIFGDSIVSLTEITAGRILDPNSIDFLLKVPAAQMSINLLAFNDSNSNGILDGIEAIGSYALNPVDLVSSNKNNLNFAISGSVANTVTVNGTVYYPDFALERTYQLVVMAFKNYSPDAAELNPEGIAIIDDPVWTDSGIDFSIRVPEDSGDIYFQANIIDKSTDTTVETALFLSKAEQEYIVSPINVSTQNINDINIYFGCYNIQGTISYALHEHGTNIFVMASESPFINSDLTYMSELSQPDNYLFCIPGYYTGLYLWTFADIIPNGIYDTGEPSAKHENELELKSLNNVDLSILQSTPLTSVSGTVFFPNYERGPIIVSLFDTNADVIIDKTISGAKEESYSFSLPSGFVNRFVYVVACNDADNDGCSDCTGDNDGNCDGTPEDNTMTIYQKFDENDYSFEMEPVIVKTEEVTGIDLYLGKVIISGNISYSGDMTGKTIVVIAFDNEKEIEIKREEFTEPGAYSFEFEAIEHTAFKKINIYAFVDHNNERDAFNNLELDYDEMYIVYSDENDEFIDLELKENYENADLIFDLNGINISGAISITGSLTTPFDGFINVVAFDSNNQIIEDKNLCSRMIEYDELLFTDICKATIYEDVGNYSFMIKRPESGQQQQVKIQSYLESYGYQNPQFEYNFGFNDILSSDLLDLTIDENTEDQNLNVNFDVFKISGKVVYKGSNTIDVNTTSVILGISTFNPQLAENSGKEPDITAKIATYRDLIHSQSDTNCLLNAGCNYEIIIPRGTGEVYFWASLDNRAEPEFNDANFNVNWVYSNGSPTLSLESNNNLTDININLND